MQLAVGGLQRLAGPGTDIRACHRLDMDTSGILVFAKGTDNLAVVQQQFENHGVSKSYIAKLSPGKPLAGGGRISLPLLLDYDDRPRQMVDFEDGKQAVTDWELLETLPGGEALVRFTPLTGRTHQLRVHAAHPLGLGRPIVGDSLYGGGPGRLCLHAATLTFTHPRTGERLSFTSDPSF